MNLTEVEEHITVKYEIKRRLGKGVSNGKLFKRAMVYTSYYYYYSLLQTTKIF